MIVNFYRNLNFAMIIFGFTIGIILVNLVLTGWTGILLNRKSPVAAERDQQRRNTHAAVTVFLLGVVFLLTNISGAVIWGLLVFTLNVSVEVGNGAVFNTIILIVLNASLNPLVVLRKQLMILCCCSAEPVVVSLNRVSPEANNVASAEPL